MNRILSIGLTAAAVAGLLSSCTTIASGKAMRVDLASHSLHDVQARLNTRSGSDVLEVELTDEEQARQMAGAGGNRPTYLLFPDTFDNGSIEVYIGAELNGKGGPDARGFAGILFHHSAVDGSYEAVYLRMTNGALNEPPPPPPRSARAIQYIAHPDLHFSVSREKFPGMYERAAPIRAGTGRHLLRLDVNGSNLSAFVDGKLVLSLNDLRYANRKGKVGFWIGDGTRAYFSDLKVTRRKK
jgi:hypothetical protein